jgi:hypothetical protein
VWYGDFFFSGHAGLGRPAAAELEPVYLLVFYFSIVVVSCSYFSLYM